MLHGLARVVESADTLGLGPSARKGVGVQIPPRAPPLTCGYAETRFLNRLWIRSRDHAVTTGAEELSQQKARHGGRLGPIIDRQCMAVTVDRFPD